MASLSAEQLAKWASGVWLGGRSPAAVTGFHQDSRQLQPGQCFVALKTPLRDGHDFLPAAREAGASCALVAQAYEQLDLPQLQVADPLAAFQAIAREYRETFSGPVVAITGSCGKTTTKELLGLLLGPRCLKTEGNLNNTIGVPLTLTGLDAALHDFAVIEVGISEPGEMEILAGMIHADLALCTLVGPAHLDQLGNLEGVAREKSRLLAQTRADGPVFFPADCLQYPEFRQLAARSRVATPPGIELPIDVLQVDNYMVDKLTEGGCRLTIESAASLSETYELPFASPGLISNAVLALSAARHLGVAPDSLRERLRNWRADGHRGVWLQRGGVRIYDDCYNANPASMAEALAAFTAATPGEEPRLYVLGCMNELGENSLRLHREVAARLPVRPQDRVIFVGREAEAYAEGLAKSGAHATSVQTVGGVEDVFAHVAGFRGSVFIKGSRGYALERVLGVFNSEEVASC